jgi:hypothetical protein
MAYKRSKQRRLRTIVADLHSPLDASHLSTLRSTLKDLQRFGVKGSDVDIAIHTSAAANEEENHQGLRPLVDHIKSALLEGSLVGVGVTPLNSSTAQGAPDAFPSSIVSGEVGIIVKLDVPRREAASIERFLEKQSVIGTVSRVYGASLPGESGTRPFGSGVRIYGSSLPGESDTLPFGSGTQVYGVFLPGESGTLPFGGAQRPKKPRRR